MGALLGLLFGLGVVLIWSAARGSARGAPPRTAPRRSDLRTRLAEAIAQAGIEGVTPSRLLLACGSVAVIAAIVVLAVSRSPTIALAFGLIGSYAPLGLVNYHRRRRQIELRDVWPDAVDNLASGIRAGLSLPEAVAQLGERGPATLRRPFQRFAADYRSTGRLGDSLDRLKAELADPTGDRVVESVRLAREVGGSDLGRVLRTLSAFLRDDARTRAELESRQTWTVNAARLAVAAPWFILALLSLRPEAVEAYNSTAGLGVLGTGAAASFLAYRLMVRIGRLPREERVLR